MSAPISFLPGVLKSLPRRSASVDIWLPDTKVFTNASIEGAGNLRAQRLWLVDPELRPATDLVMNQLSQGLCIDICSFLRGMVHFEILFFTSSWCGLLGPQMLLTHSTWLTS